MCILNSLLLSNVDAGTLWGILTSSLSQSIKKIEGGSFQCNTKISKKSLIVPQKVERGTLGFRMVLYFKLEVLDALKFKY